MLEYGHALCEAASAPSRDEGDAFITPLLSLPAGAWAADVKRLLMFPGTWRFGRAVGRQPIKIVTTLRNRMERMLDATAEWRGADRAGRAAQGEAPGRGDRVTARGASFTTKQIELVTISPTRPSLLSRTARLSASCAVTAAADRDRRCAQGDQPVDVRPAERCSAPDRGGGRLCRPIRGDNSPSGDGFFYGTFYEFPDRLLELVRWPVETGRGSIVARTCWKKSNVHMSMSAQTRITYGQRLKS